MHPLTRLLTDLPTHRQVVAQAHNQVTRSPGHHSHEHLAPPPTTYQEVARHPNRLDASVPFQEATLLERKLNARRVRDFKLAMECGTATARVVVYGRFKVGWYQLSFPRHNVDRRLLLADPTQLLLKFDSAPIFGVTSKALRGSPTRPWRQSHHNVAYTG